jgi:hypothetical protein
VLPGGQLGAICVPKTKRIPIRASMPVETYPLLKCGDRLRSGIDGSLSFAIPVRERGFYESLAKTVNANARVFLPKYLRLSSFGCCCRAKENPTVRFVLRHHLTARLGSDGLRESWRGAAKSDRPLLGSFLLITSDSLVPSNKLATITRAQRQQDLARRVRDEPH